MFGDAFHRPSSHLALKFKEGFAVGPTHIGQSKLRSIALAEPNQPSFLYELLDDLVQLGCVDEGLHGVEESIPRDGASLVEDV